jgi:hypothetical protein
MTQQRKSIRLEFAGGQKLGARVYAITHTFADGRIEVRNPVLGEMILTPVSEGTWANQYRVLFIEEKPDRRPKPYAVSCYHATEDRTTTWKKFATLEEAAQYIYARWQGEDYQDGPMGFHTDYCQYTLKGYRLADIFDFNVVNGWRDATRKFDAKETN